MDAQGALGLSETNHRPEVNDMKRSSERHVLRLCVPFGDRPATGRLGQVLR
jgi:hypothetical protein